MIKHLSRIIIPTVIIISMSLPLNASESTQHIVAGNGVRVKIAIRKQWTLPDLSTNRVRDVVKLDLHPVFHGQYTLGLSDELLSQPDKYVARYMEWNTKPAIHSDQIRMVVIYGIDIANNALDGLFEIMGSGTSMAITPSTFDLLRNGPGNIAFAMPTGQKEEGGTIKILGAIWFCRDNIAVQLTCSGGVDLLPIAKAIDRVIQSCPIIRD